ncbi:hypothetical protein [Pelagicoccus sp. SDUM812002]|nr:hypothetical protein [Pelagicoccus sp. SDUM812002]MDQ8184644.1 hypothetical protein [Pelagicoccus sp. SDUM812002]
MAPLKGDFFSWAFIGFDAIPNGLDLSGESKSIWLRRIKLYLGSTFGIDL